MKEGDRLIMFSDGVPDSFNSNHEQFGVERLANLITENAQMTAENLVQVIAREVNNWRENTPANDDLTLLVLEVKR